MKTFFLLLLQISLIIPGIAQTISPLNDTIELQHYDNGQNLKVRYLLNGYPISLKHRDNLLAKHTHYKQEFNIKYISGDTIGEVNLLADQLVKISTEDINTIETKPATINIFNKLVGTAFPLFSWTGINGKKFSTETLKGKIIVLNFWHKSCGPCIAEMPLLNELVEKYKGKEVVFIALTQNTVEELNNFLKKRNFNYSQVASEDPKKIFDPMPGWPIHIIIDGNGIIRFSVLGKQPLIEQRISDTIDQSLKAP
ncbi:MAG: TlpA disulfide reductase family protein [Ferruginibacter sp.]